MLLGKRLIEYSFILIPNSRIVKIPICFSTTAKVAYNIATTIPINYKQGYTIPEIVSLLSQSFKALYLTFVSRNH